MLLMTDKKSIKINVALFAAIIFGYATFTTLWTQPGPKILSYESVSLQVPLTPLNSPAPQTPVTLKDFRGQALLIHFWASWCEACEADRSRFEQLAKKYHGPIKMIGIASSDQRDAIEKSGKLSGSAYPQFLEPTGNLALALDVKSLPQTLLIDSSGKVVAQFREAIDEQQMTSLEKTMAKLPATDVAVGNVPMFELESSSGVKVNRGNLDNKVWVADFIFTSCSSQCPMLTEKMKTLQEQFKSNEDFKLVSISVDPKTDRPAVLKNYQEQHGADPSHWYFLTGTFDSVMNLLVDGFKLGTRSAPQLHTQRFVLVDRMDRIRGYYDADSPESFAKLKTDIGQLLQ
jgi:protein SCO1